MPDGEGLLADIRDHPDDDALRLVYADWLEDAGDSTRAEFVRAQVRRSALPAESPEALALASREAELMREHEGAWTHNLVREGVIFWKFARGLVEAVVIHADRFLLRAERLYELAPIRDVTLDNVAPVLRQLAARPWMCRPLRALRLAKPNDGVGLSVSALADMTESDELDGLQTLDLQGARLGRNNGLAEALGRLPSLAELGLARNEITDLGLIAFLVAGGHRTLRALDLRGNLLTDNAAQALTGWPAASSLRALLLAGNNISPRGVAALRASANLRGVKRLEVG